MHIHPKNHDKWDWNQVLYFLVLKVLSSKKRYKDAKRREIICGRTPQVGAVAIAKE